MKCDSCGKTFEDDIIAFCEKCEKYYCMNCSIKHKHNEINFLRIEDNQLTRINTGIGGAGIGDTHHKFYTDKKWISRHRPCKHAEQELKIGKPIFYCDDGKIRCTDCLYESGIINVEPIIKTEDEKLLLLLTHTFEPQNLEFRVKCDKKGVKGGKVTLKLIIENKKSHEIRDINIRIESFAANPLPQNKNLNIYREEMYSRYLIYKKILIQSIKSKERKTIELEVDIPEDGEIKENQFVNFEVEGIENNNDNPESLKVPNDLMIYAQFTYKTFLGFEYWSYVEEEIVKLK
ncbi:hypothetical protein [Methanobrevibacter thaueri]|uniref:B box-type domain-containing protein n=1 Tax=Methanobrevibacter thaueri TaxID=190975 RepID=A0A315XNX9_9EURY|nr:hypothetical protein [Methanobrevibacter thaueri]PWB88076.1 hypothetical protein MBBTH_02200 [Methanobrevibacter thaueri]